MSDVNKIQRCLVTGASGFLGKYLLEHLQQQKIFIRALVRDAQNSDLPCHQTVVGELSPIVRCESWLEGIDTVFYLAGTAHLSAAPEQYEADYLAVINMARQALAMGVQRFVFVSTTKAAADAGERVCDESWDAWPIDPYGYWKRKTEIALRGIGIPHLVVVRPCLIYGAGVKGNLQKMIQGVERGYFPPLHNVNAQRSMVFAGDVASAIWLVAVHNDANRQIFIVADDELYTTSNLYAGIRVALGKLPVKWGVPLFLLEAAGVFGEAVKNLGIELPVNRGVVKRLTEPAIYSAGKLKLLGWTPTTTFFCELPKIISVMHHHE